MLREQKIYFVIEIIVCLICFFVIGGFIFVRNNNHIETTVSAIGFASIYLLGFFFVLNDTVLEDFDVAKKVLVILYYVLTLTIIFLLPVIAKVPYKELFATKGDNLEHPIAMMMIICGVYVLCYPVIHFFTKKHNCLLQLLIKPAAPLIIPAFPILVIILLVKVKREVFGVSDHSYYSGTETKEYLINEYGKEEEIDGRSGFSVHTSSGWHDQNDDGTYN